MRNYVYLQFSLAIFREDPPWELWQGGNKVIIEGKRSRRLIIPSCLKMRVRQMYPNLPGVAYGGDIQYAQNKLLQVHGVVCEEFSDEEGRVWY